MKTEEKIKYIRSRVSNLLNDNETSRQELDELKNNIAGLCEHFGAEEIVDLGVKLLRLERERDEALEDLENYRAASIHSCHDNCKRPMCVLRRERDAAQEEQAEVASLREKIKRIKTQLHAVMWHIEK